MKVALTGANGKVGRFVTRELLDQGYDVRAIDATDDQQVDANNRVQFVQADVTHFEQMQAALEGCERLIHLAAIPSPRKNQDSFVYETNTMGVFNTLLAAGLEGIHHAAVASSDCAFGFTYAIQETLPDYVPVDEAHPVRPDNCYGLSKVVGEQIAEAMAKRFNMSIASLRITYVVDPATYGKSHFREGLVDPKNGRSNLWSYIDARDCARAFRMAMEKGLGGHDVFSITAVNNRCTVPVQDLVREYFPNAQVRPGFEGDLSFQQCQKAAQILGFRPQYRWDDNV